jgi:hypothetical protein
MLVNTRLELQEQIDVEPAIRPSYTPDEIVITSAQIITHVAAGHQL